MSTKSNKHKSQKTERLQKYMARAGVASRRASEKMIENGRVQVNGRTITEMGVKVNPQRDKVMVDGKPIKLAKNSAVYIMLYKPRYIISSTKDNEHGRRTVMDCVKIDERLYPVGRLDYKSEGLILLTNDGNLTHKLTHPSFNHEREYHVLLEEHPSQDTLRRWRKGGFEVDGKPVQPMNVVPISSDRPGWLRVILKEGRNRQIRKIAEILNNHVIGLNRVRFGTLKIGNLKPGAWRHLTQREVIALKMSVKHQ
ncbi:MAG: hypothetical protein B6242_14490 [Anaerolineaceae bacterium 4572_78]|nr:MAG: hypothetical protein B6242_14490 [Anaerolineaceae bacterium 4572_78]